MTKKEFIEKYGEFQINKSTTEELIEQFANTTSNLNKNEVSFFMEAIAYNHGIIKGDLNSFNTNWELLAQDLAIANELENSLNGLFYHTYKKINFPYKALVFPNFKIHGPFICSLNYNFGLKIIKPKNFNELEISVEELKLNEPVLIRPNYLNDEDILKYNQIDLLFHEKLNHLKRIYMFNCQEKFSGEYVFDGASPIFYVGKTNSKNLVGIFTVFN